MRSGSRLPLVRRIERIDGSSQRPLPPTRPHGPRPDLADRGRADDRRCPPRQLEVLLRHSQHDSASWLAPSRSDADLPARPAVGCPGAHQGRRRLDVILIAGGSLVTGCIAVFGVAIYNEERIDRMWVGAAVDVDGSGALHEVIDYNFGTATDRHGLLRRIPGLLPSDPSCVDSARRRAGRHQLDGAVDGSGWDRRLRDQGRRRRRHRERQAPLHPRLPPLDPHEGRRGGVQRRRPGLGGRGRHRATSSWSPRSSSTTSSTRVGVRQHRHLRGGRGRRATSSSTWASSTSSTASRSTPRGADLAARPELATPPGLCTRRRGCRPGRPGHGHRGAPPARPGARLHRAAGRSSVDDGRGRSTDAFAAGGSEELVDATDPADQATTDVRPARGAHRPDGQHPHGRVAAGEPQGGLAHRGRHPGS